MVYHSEKYSKIDTTPMLFISKPAPSGLGAFATPQESQQISSPLSRRPFKISAKKIANLGKAIHAKISFKAIASVRQKVLEDAYSDSSSSLSTDTLKTSGYKVCSASVVPTDPLLPPLKYGTPFSVPEFESFDPHHWQPKKDPPPVIASLPEEAEQSMPACQQTSRADSVLGSQHSQESGIPHKKHSKKSKIINWGHQANMIKHSGSAFRTTVKSTSQIPEIPTAGPKADELKDGLKENLAADLATKCLHDQDGTGGINKDDEEYSGDDDEDGGNEDEECYSEYARCDFKTIMATSDAKFLELVQSHCGFPATESLSIVKRTNGTFNYAVIVAQSEEEGGKGLREYVVRIPGHATPAQWTPEDAYMIEREVQLIEYIRNNTTAPVPQVIDFSLSHENVLGYPYILMTKLPGQSATSIWFDQPYDPYNAQEAYRTADVPSTATEKKRITFLRSVAHHMTSIQQLSFSEIGMPIISDTKHPPAIGPRYYWKSDGSDEAIERPTAQTTKEYALRTMVSKLKQTVPDDIDEAFHKASGNRRILGMVFSNLVGCAGTSETFTIHHDDLDLQNILVDQEGNVTGIIDWDKSYAAPRCIGAAAVPVFLRNDWFPRYAHDLRFAPHMGWNYAYYRTIYAAAMVEAGNPDAKFTLKSGLYQSCFAAITEGGDRYDLVEKLLHAIPDCHVDAEDFQIALGLGWDSARDMLKTELRKILEPELPAEDFLARIDTAIALKEWWSTYDKYLQEEEEEDDDAQEEGSEEDETDDQMEKESSEDSKSELTQEFDGDSNTELDEESDGEAESELDSTVKASFS